MNNEQLSMSPNYSMVFNFEKEFDQDGKRKWMQAHWQQSVYLSIIYVLAIFSIKSYMRNRPPFNLRMPLVIWNAGLAIFSIIGAWRTLPELLHICLKFGFKVSVCNDRFFQDSQVVSFWEWAFAISKVIELGDTMFVVLRKQKLMFLHWYHHITVLVFCFYAYKEHCATARWLMTMNLLVHSFMYSYFALRAMGVKVPRPIAMVITSSQMIQMMIFLVVNFKAYVVKVSGQYCQVPDNVSSFAFMLSLSYFFLFTKFFYTTYLKRTAKATVKKEE